MSALSSSSVLSLPNTSSSSSQDLTQIPNTLSPMPLLPDTTPETDAVVVLSNNGVGDNVFGFESSPG